MDKIKNITNLILLFESESSWDSYSRIKEGYLAFYEEVYEKNIIFYSKKDPNSGKELLSFILKNDINVISLVDNQIRIPKEFHYFLQEIKPEKLKELHFNIHIYGCFIGRIPEYAFMCKYFSGCQIDIIVGSESQKKLVSKVLNLSKEPLVIPFPVLNIDQREIKNRSRESFGIKEEDTVLIYSGRVSPGKNIPVLCDIINLLNQNNKKKFFLFIVGSIDDYGLPETISNSLNGFMCINFSKKLEIVNKIEKYVHYIPHIDIKNELFSYYLMADIFISLSTYLYEDYGMAVAEAISLNKPLILTQWGGYKDFYKISRNIDYVKVEVIDGNIEFNIEDVVDKILQSNKMQLQKYNNELSVLTLSSIYKNRLLAKEVNVMSISKVGQAAILKNSSYEILKHDYLKVIYDPYWI